MMLATILLSALLACSASWAAPIPASLADYAKNLPVRFLFPSSTDVLTVGGTYELRAQLDLSDTARYPSQGIRFQLYRAGARFGLVSAPVEGAFVDVKSPVSGLLEGKFTIPKLAQGLASSSDRAETLSAQYYIRAERIGAMISGVLGQSDTFRIKNPQAGQKSFAKSQSSSIVSSIISPIAGDSFTAGSTMDISWRFDNQVAPGSTLTVKLVRNRLIRSEIPVSTVTTIQSPQTEVFRASWLIPSDTLPSNNYRLAFYLKRGLLRGTHKVFESGLFSIKSPMSARRFVKEIA